MPGFWDNYDKQPPPPPKPEERPKCSRCLVAYATDGGMCYWCWQIENNKTERCPGCGRTSCSCPW